MSHQQMSMGVSPPGRFSADRLALSNLELAPPSNLIGSLPKYLIDAFQRNILFLDILRRRGNEEIEITSRPMATVLRFEHELLMNGRSLPRPINYALYRIKPPT